MFNIMGSIVAAVVSMAFGFFWYSNFLFGRKWRNEMKWTDSQMMENKEKGMFKVVVLGLLAEFATALVLSYFLFALGVVGILPSLVVAFWAWLGFSATLQFGEILWAKHSGSLFLINTSHRLISLCLMALIISLF